MKEAEKIKEKFGKARADTKAYLKKQKIEHHMFYGPATDSYYSNEWRIMFLNMEAYGYEDCGLVDVAGMELKRWLYDDGGTNTKTVRYSMAIAATLLSALSHKKKPTADLVSDAYHSHEILDDTLAKIVYYNIRPTSNPEIAQDAQAIAQSASLGIAPYIVAEIQALEPHAIIVSGEAGLAAFNDMFGTNLEFHGQVKLKSGTVVKSISHPSRPSYDRFASEIQQIVDFSRK